MEPYKIVYSFDDSGIWHTFFETYDALFFNLVWDDVQVYCKKYIKLIQNKTDVVLDHVVDDSLIYTIGNETREVLMFPLWLSLCIPKSFKCFYVKEIKPPGNKQEDSIHQSRICEYVL